VGYIITFKTKEYKSKQHKKESFDYSIKLYLAGSHHVQINNKEKISQPLFSFRAYAV